jgi:hypothetical protein
MPRIARLVDVYKAQGPEAEPLFKRTLTIFARAFGGNHPRQLRDLRFARLVASV